MGVTIDQARAAKKKAATLARELAEVIGVGLIGRDGSYAVKVNLKEPAEASLPGEVDGVPIVYEVVGTIRARLD